jgi:hypothetical protein
MWLCTQLGFYSVVRKPDGLFHIRARSRGDLDALADAIGLPEPVPSHPGSDYPWRILCDATDLTRFFALMAASITYDNFKAAIARHPVQQRKLAAYHDLHQRLLEWQHNQAH